LERSKGQKKARAHDPLLHLDFCGKNASDDTVLTPSPATSFDRIGLSLAILLFWPPTVRHDPRVQMPDLFARDAGDLLEFFNGENCARLAAVKKKYDPANLTRSRPSIPSATRSRILVAILASPIPYQVRLS
jgi:hypothetical protein